mgnify:CR=1 FL=1
MTPEQTFNIIAPVKLHRQRAYLLRRKGCPRHIIAHPADTVTAVITAVVGHKDLKQRYTAAVPRKSMADARSVAVAHPLAVICPFRSR